LALTTLIATGCNSGQAVTNPATGPAREINTLWWAMFAGAMVVFAAVLVLLVLAFVRRHRDDASDGDRGPYMVIVGGGLAAPIVLLAILFGFVIHVMSATSAPTPGTTRLTVDVIGHQWFWEVRYPGTTAVTANEIHIPAGKPVYVTLKARRYAGRRPRDHGRRDPQLLGATSQPQDRHDPRPREPGQARRSRPRRLPRPMLGVLRRRPR
jgi:cytochrome c oxidase subunit 2